MWLRNRCCSHRISLRNVSNALKGDCSHHHMSSRNINCSDYDIFQSKVSNALKEQQRLASHFSRKQKTVISKVTAHIIACPEGKAIAQIITSSCAKKAMSCSHHISLGKPNNDFEGVCSQHHMSLRKGNCPDHHMFLSKMGKALKEQQLLASHFSGKIK